MMDEVYECLLQKADGSAWFGRLFYGEESVMRVEFHGIEEGLDEKQEFDN